MATNITDEPTREKRQVLFGEAVPTAISFLKLSTILITASDIGPYFAFFSLH